MAATFSATFIDTDYLRTITPYGDNIDSEQIAPFIQQAQDKYIQDILGGTYYDSLCYTIYTATASPNFSAVDNIVVELASKCLAFWAVYDAIPHLSIKIKNIGVVSPTADHVETSDMAKMRYIREEVKNDAEFWQKRLIDYLGVNSSLYPLYTGSNNLVSPSGASYDSDIYLEGGCGCGSGARLGSNGLYGCGCNQ